MPSSSEVRAELDHPVVDADGHVLEFLPAALPYLRDALGPTAFERYQAGRTALGMSIGGESSMEWRRRTRAPQSAWWGTPAGNTRDLATAALPGLLYERLDEFGIDHAVLFPTKALGSGRYDDDELRRGVCRGFNDYLAETWAPYRDRLTVSGIIPMHTPEEAIAELHHCADIGLRVVGIPEGVWRPIPEPADPPSPWLTPGQSHWFDNFGLDSQYDYDPVWSTMCELGFPLISHGGLGHIAPNQYMSISNYSANHIGSFRDKMFQLCKSLYMAGVTQRFPELNLGFLECGVAWASTLLADVCEHWEKRHAGVIGSLDPAGIDYDELERLFRRYGPELLEGLEDVRDALSGVPTVGTPPEERDDWRFLDVSSEEELMELFAPRCYFGCEADDRGVAVAFSAANPGGVDLRPVFSSDIAHWDVPDMAGVVAESFELVDEGLITREQYRSFVLDNPVRLFATTNPGFFDGTPVEGAARELLGTPTPA